MFFLFKHETSYEVRISDWCSDGCSSDLMVVCSFMWAAEAGIDVTNNSYFADPWLFNCRNDAEQRAIWTAERRAIRFAMSKEIVRELCRERVCQYVSIWVDAVYLNNNKQEPIRVSISPYQIK